MLNNKMFKKNLLTIAFTLPFFDTQMYFFETFPKIVTIPFSPTPLISRMPKKNLY